MLNKTLFSVLLILILQVSVVAESIPYSSNFLISNSGFSVIETSSGSIALSRVYNDFSFCLKVSAASSATGKAGVSIDRSSGLSWATHLADWWKIELKAKTNITQGTARLGIKCVDENENLITLIDLGEIPYSSTAQQLTFLAGVPVVAPDRITYEDHAYLSVILDNAQGDVWLSNVNITHYEMSESEIEQWNVSGPVDFGGQPWNDPAYEPIDSEDPVLADTGHKLLVAAGVTKMRMLMYWGQDRPLDDLPVIEYEEDVYNFEQVDALIDDLEQYGAGVGFATITGLPTEWDFDMSDYCEMVYEVVSHFKNRIKIWEVFNEPDGYGLVTIDEYPEYLRNFYQVAKSADPDCIVLCGRVGPWLPYLMADGEIIPYMDGLATHPYPGTEQPFERVITNIRACQKAMMVAGIQKPIYVTELGFSAGGSWPGPGGYRTETIKAQGIYEVFPELAQLTNHISWYMPIYAGRRYSLIKSEPDKYVPQDAYWAYGQVSGHLGSNCPVSVSINSQGTLTNWAEEFVTISATNDSGVNQDIKFWPVGFVPNIGYDAVEQIQQYEWQGTLSPGQTHTETIPVLPNHLAQGRYPVGVAIITEQGYENAVALNDLWIETIAAQSAVSSSYSNSNDGILFAVNDLLAPDWAFDESTPYLSWLGHEGTTEWLQYDFQQTQNIYGLEIYWLDDTEPKYPFKSWDYDTYRIPQSWYVEYWNGNAWQQITDTSGYYSRRGQFNSVTFDPLQTDKIRVLANLKSGYSGGIYECRVLSKFDTCARAIEPMPSDIDSNCIVDMFDLIELFSNWLQSTNP